MWAVLKIDSKNISLLRKELSKRLGPDIKFYIPMIQLKKFVKKKTYFKEISLLGDYLLCFHKDFSKKTVLTSLKYCKGLKYFLNDFINSQNEIEEFIKKCKENENQNGFIKSTFFELKKSNNYQFISGPFTNMIFNIVQENKLNIKAIIGNYRVTVSKSENLFRTV
tara:strand:+ start:1150 stop:1647 length:498 start_codon:yes stop_codon:yes gene_type:complete